MRFKTSVLPLVCVLLCVGWVLVTVSPVSADETLVWQDQVFSSGAVVTSPVLSAGKSYRIVAMDTWWYNYDENLAADAMYYTTDFTNNIFWGNHFPAPGGHSFLQINAQDVDWGPFSNGEENHTYAIHRVGAGASLTFRIVDWIDGNYTNNVCHIHVFIYERTVVGGSVVDGMQGLLVYFVVSAFILASAIAVPFARKIYR